MESLTTYQYFADGEWHEPASRKWIESENPATCEVWARIPDCNEVDVDRAVQAAKSAFYGGPWPQMNGTERGKILRSIGDAVIANAERLG